MYTVEIHHHGAKIIRIDGEDAECETWTWKRLKELAKNPNVPIMVKVFEWQQD
jgi:hypothetical protein